MPIQKITSGIIQDGAIEAADIVSIANTQITGNIVSSQITSVANTQITGNIISSQITSVANTQITGNIAATNISGGSNGTIPYQSASGTTQMLAVGTSGQLLQTNGAGAPSWVTASSGALTLLASVDASGAGTADFTTQITSTYDKYMITAQGVSLGGGASYAAMRFFVSSVIRTTSYGFAALYMDTAITASGANNQGSMRFTNATNLNVGGVFYIYRGNTADHATTTFNIGGGDGTCVAYLGSGTLNANLQINGIRLLAEGGTFTTGVFRLYGIAKT